MENKAKHVNNDHVGLMLATTGRVGEGGKTRGGGDRAGRFQLRTFKTKKCFLEQLSCDKAVNNGSTCSVLFLSTTGLFPARRKNFGARDRVKCSNVFLSIGNNPGVL